MKELRCPHCNQPFTINETEYEELLSQVKTEAFQEEIHQRLQEMQERQQTELRLATAQTEQAHQAKLNQLQQTLADKDRQISELRSTISQNDSHLQLALMEERQKALQTMQTKEQEINQLRTAVELEKRESQINEAALIKRHEEELRMKQEQVDYYKDLKTRMSTKMVGETLEQHCSIEFEQYIRPMMPNAQFGKDNDASEGSKGDFIFRDSEDGTEYISIMFEMKNENDTTANKHKNEDFLKKLDEDRRKKGCEFAVLVSLLEADNDLYNTGIVNKSHLYPKMYVIRPQFFVPFINLLVQTSKKSLDYKRQLAIAQSQSVDVTNFENQLLDFQDKFGKNYRLASEKFKTAVEEIDKTIQHLQKIKEALQGSENNLRLANDKAEALTIKRLTRNNPTMSEAFKQARLKGEDIDVTNETHEKQYED